MDILNQLPPKQFRNVDDLLAFISIYDDAQRTSAYRKLLRAHRKEIRDSVCVEGGCGLGLFSVDLARLGARKVYAVEQNPMLAKLAQKRIGQLPADIRNRIDIINIPLQKFKPSEKIDVLVHEFYGQLLYDEDLWVLEKLRFRPRLVLPNGGEVWAGVVSSSRYKDRIVNADVVRKLDGVLISGLFQEHFNELKLPVLRWKFGSGVKPVKHSLRSFTGDLLCLGLRVTHDGRTICEAGKCPNWSYAWTYRRGNRVLLLFKKSTGMIETKFRWV